MSALGAYRATQPPKAGADWQGPQFLDYDNESVITLVFTIERIMLRLHKKDVVFLRGLGIIIGALE